MIIPEAVMTLFPGTDNSESQNVKCRSIITLFPGYRIIIVRISKLIPCFRVSTFNLL